MKISKLQTAAAAAAFLACAACSAAGIAGFHANCSVCHQGNPPSVDNADPEACIACHGEAPEVGSVVVNSKAINPHQSHFDVYECSACHPAHKSGIAGCAECHAVSDVQMPNK